MNSKGRDLPTGRVVSNTAAESTSETIIHGGRTILRILVLKLIKIKQEKNHVSSKDYEAFSNTSRIIQENSV